jgi:hypothetical protein
MWHHFKLLPFLAGLVVGYVIFFVFKPETAIDRTVRWPNPENAGKTTYRDRNGLCYKFDAQIVDCGKVKESLVAYSFE